MRSVYQLITVNSLMCLSLAYVKWWNISWLFIAIVSPLAIFLMHPSPRAIMWLDLLVADLMLGVKSYLYIKITQSLKSVMGRNSSQKSEKLKKISINLIVLFLLDLISLTTGAFENSIQSASTKFLEVLPEGSFFYTSYESIYKYIPVLFDFINPRLDGVELLFFATLAYFFSGMLLTTDSEKCG